MIAHSFCLVPGREVQDFQLNGLTVKDFLDGIMRSMRSDNPALKTLTGLLELQRWAIYVRIYQTCEVSGCLHRETNSSCRLCGRRTAMCQDQVHSPRQRRRI